jgi:FkbM family methyltransferase
MPPASARSADIGDEDLRLDAALNGLGRRAGAGVFILVIGAMDGVSYDRMRPHVDRFGWSGLFVEPVPELFDRLVQSFAGAAHERSLCFERAAIAGTGDDVGTEIEMIRIPPRAIESGGLDQCFLGMSTLLPPRNGFTSERDRVHLERHGERIRVPSTTLPALLAKHRVERVDVLQIDVEGYDWAVLRQFDFTRYRPSVVCAERCNLPPDEQVAMEAHLEAQGYDVFHTGQDLTGIAHDAPHIDATFVTAAYERHPHDAVGGRGFPIERCLQSLRSLARMGAPLVVYTQHRHVDRLTEFFAHEHAAARVVGRSLSTVPRFWAIEELRLRHRVHTLPYRDRCHVLCLAKFAWLAEQARRDLFRTTRCYWIDAGLASSELFPASRLPRPEGTCDLFSEAVPAGLGRSPGFAVFELAPIAGRNMHSVDVGDMERIAGAGSAPIATHIVGGLFGGRRDEVLALYGEYDAVLAEMLGADLLGTEENILTILYHRNRSRFTPHTFSMWYHEDTDFIQPAPGDVPFYRAFEALTAAQ